MVLKCRSCGKEFWLVNKKKNYIYKLKEFRTGKIHYFCSWTCKQTEKKEHPDKYSKKR